VSPVAHAASLIKLGVQVTHALNVGRFSEGQRRYLRFHRESVLLKSKYLEDAS
jgi:putative restriction endonuclease